MSGEYFEEDDTRLYQDYIEENNHDDNQEKIQHIANEIEHVESRCQSLEGQLAYMKNLYGPASKHQKVRKYSNSSFKKRESKNDSPISSDIHVENFGNIKSESARQHINDQAKDIHSIINGITNSVNRLSDLHLQIAETPKSRRIESCRQNKMDTPKSKVLESSHFNNFEMNPVKMDSTSRFEKFSTNLVTKKSSKISKKKLIIPLDSRIKKFASNHTVPTKTASGNVLKKRTKNQNLPSTDFVEIYHNKAVKETDSEHSAHGKYNRRKSKTSRSEYISDIPPLSLNVPDDWKNGDYKVHKTMPDVNTDSTYQLPTIASKMKQVAKCYFNSLNFKAIPFCPASSTSPSHNIGINLQQVMSMIKTKQPFQGLSPTLAHNIGLAAERLNSRPASMMVTSMTSRVGTCTSFLRTNSCPFSKNRLNYQHLQEMAKGIPEEDILLEGEDESRDSPSIKTTYITGPSGDMKIESKHEPIWAADADNSKKCTCVNTTGSDLYQMVNKYQICQPPNSVQSTAPRFVKTKNVIAKKKLKPVKMALVTKNNGIITNNGNFVEETTTEEPLHVKQRTLKGVLANLHLEFDKMNTRYLELSKLGESMNEENVKELQQLDKDLSAKEEEITMVMSLYKEVLALKQQVQTLKQKTSAASVISKMADYSNPKAAFHLTKLLKQIQLCQSHYKKDLPIM